jgi:hypothetical protein
MTDLKERIADAMVNFTENFDKHAAKGNKAAGARARKASLELEKLFKEYRKASIEADKK